ncbi:MAG: FtsH protease activity modulator HflK [Proteobacteria bacterium]|jgi:membrane protease subunit HflK|nr:FtsH protease activity modulator HflK [Alphaproteobacteria bacterium]NCC02556.1 FtsH protease activity modulator HflK [Pseudomonadota bacterium]
MSSENDDGPWGAPSDQGNAKKDQRKDRIIPPWMGKDSGQPEGGPTPTPPQFDDILNGAKDYLNRYKPESNLHAFLLLVGALVTLWLLSGFYMVGTNQLGVVMRFGGFHHTDDPGLRYHLPAPIEEVLLPIVTAQNEIQIGFRGSSRSTESARSVPEESMMLTQDENLINVQFAVFWRIKEVNNYLFEIRDPELTIKMAAESVMREVIGQNKLQFALTEGRGQIAEEARERLQNLVDEYKTGVTITQINLQTVAVPDDVKAAFQDVVNARLDMERFQNQAAAHVNKVIPESKGEAAKLLQEAKAYRDQKIAVAKGDAERFEEVLTAYNGSKDVTKKRLYLETMEEILSHANKIITDKSPATFPIYPLQDMMQKNKGE